MKRGAQSIIESLAFELLQRWVPKWYEAFCDHDLGGFYERLGHSFKPVLTGRRRLLTQCRQLSIYSHAHMLGIGRELPDIEAQFEFIVSRYYMQGGPEGSWIFALDDDGQILDRTYDLYGHAFVIFSLSHYYQAFGDERAREIASQTLSFIDKYFRVSGQAGFCEALDEKLKPLPQKRRHESHMHLLEACLFAAAQFKNQDYIRMADEIVDLFMRRFYQADENILSEYFTDDLKILPEGRDVILEPGHYFEWIWLLKKHAKLRGDVGQYDALCLKMARWANKTGWDKKYGGFFDEMSLDGKIVLDSKRIWPLTEGLKANALMLDSGGDKEFLKVMIRKIVRLLRGHYFEARGFWTESLARDMRDVTDYMPGTTPYHVYFGIMETREVLNMRGKTRSLITRPQLFFYQLRRRVSDMVRDVRFWFKN